MNKNQKTFLCVGVVGVGLVAYAILSKNNSNKKQQQRVVSTPIKEKKDLTIDNPIPKEISLDEYNSGVFLGRKPNGQLGYVGKPSNEDGHVLVVGGSGSGKTSSIAEPTARTWKESTVSVLIKGDHNERISRLQEEGRRVITFDPAASWENKVRYDVFSILDHHPEDLVNNACAIAETLLPLPEETRDPVWAEAAQAFLTGSILYFYSLGCSFPEMIRAISSQSVLDIVLAIMESGNRDAMGFASRLYSVDVRLLQNTGFELVSLSRFLSPQIMTAFTEEPDCIVLDWEELNHSTIPVDIILVIPEAKLDQWRPMLVLMIEQLIRTLMNRPERTYDDRENLPALLVSLDEFNRLGKIPAILSGLTTLRSRGVTFLLMIQSLAALDLIYGELRTRVILENCTYKIVLKVSEVKGQQYFSDLIGSTATLDESSNCGTNIGISLPAGVSVGKSESKSYTLGRRPYIFPDAFADFNEVLCITPYGVCQAAKTPYYAK